MKNLKTFVLIISPKFPKGHPSEGQLTEFRAKIPDGRKKHTLRKNSAWWRHQVRQVERGEAIISVREWSGLPYRSKQRELFRLGKGDVRCTLIRKHDTDTWSHAPNTLIDIVDLAADDGLETADFRAWFRDTEIGAVFACIHFDKFQK